MPTKVYQTLINCSQKDLWQFHSSVEALQKLTLPRQKIELLSQETKVEKGVKQTIKVKELGLSMTWEVEIIACEPPFFFIDKAHKSPFAFWEHKHEFIPEGNRCTLKDTVTYKMKGGFLAPLIEAITVNGKIDKLFHHRHKLTKELLESKTSADQAQQ